MGVGDLVLNLIAEKVFIVRNEIVQYIDYMLHAWMIIIGLYNLMTVCVANISLLSH